MENLNEPLLALLPLTAPEKNRRQEVLTALCFTPPLARTKKNAASGGFVEGLLLNFTASFKLLESLG